MDKRGLMERLETEGIVCAEGCFLKERRGYIAAGTFLPEMATEHPETLDALRRDFQNAESDVISQPPSWLAYEFSKVANRGRDFHAS
jgi:betaine-homocysteine S-methyltransferase